MKINNITFSGSVSEPEFHIVDYGWACHFCQIPMDLMFPRAYDDYGDSCDIDPNQIVPWMAPEVLMRKPVWSSGDVYSFGFLVECVMENCPHTFLTKDLRKIAKSCMEKDPKLRPSLSLVSENMCRITQELTPQQLSEKFIFEE